MLLLTIKNLCRWPTPWHSLVLGQRFLCPVLAFQISSLLPHSQSRFQKKNIFSHFKLSVLSLKRWFLTRFHMVSFHRRGWCWPALMGISTFTTYRTRWRGLVHHLESDNAILFKFVPHLFLSWEWWGVSGSHNYCCFREGIVSWWSNIGWIQSVEARWRILFSSSVFY